MKSVLVTSKHRIEIQEASDMGTGMRKIALRGEDLVVSDGYHTIDELYEHRIVLFIALAKSIKKLTDGEGPEWYPVWRSKKHADGSGYEGWFILGIGKDDGTQMTYHLPDRCWGDTEFAETLPKAPEFDKHTPDDVLKRLKKL